MSPQGSSISPPQKRKAQHTESPAQRARQAPDIVQGSSNPEARLISLPDDPLSTIFSFLTKTTTGTLIREPHSAFALAKAHSRPLHLLASQLTHVTTDENFLRPSYVLLVQPKVLLEFTAAGGKALRNLHLDSLHCGHLKDLSRFCPLLEAFSVSNTHDCEGCCDTLQSILGLNLRSLTVPGVSQKILGMIETPPPELSLTQVPEFSKELERILERTSKNVTLEFHLPYSYNGILCHIDKWVPGLSGLCSRAESVSMSLVPHPPRSDLQVRHAVHYITSAGKDGAMSRCRSIKLSSYPLFQLLKYVHPNACVELTEGETVFVRGEDGIFAKKIPLWSAFLETDLSRIEEVVIERNTDEAWKNVLCGKKIARARVRNLPKAEFLSLDMEVVYIESQIITGQNWYWLSGAREVHILRSSHRARRKNFTHLMALLNGLPSLMDNFTGYMVWVHDLAEYRYRAPLAVRQAVVLPHKYMASVARRASDIAILRRGWKDSVRAVRRFERRGGNGEMVMTMLEDVQRFLFTECGIEVRMD